MGSIFIVLSCNIMYFCLYKTKTLQRDLTEVRGFRLKKDKEGLSSWLSPRRLLRLPIPEGRLAPI